MKMPPEADRAVGLDEKAAEGGYPSAAPIGYQNVDDDIGITPHHQRAPIVKELFAVAATGEYSGQQLTRFAQHRGLRSRRGLVLNKDTVCETILRNPAYYGTFRWGGKTLTISDLRWMAGVKLLRNMVRPARFERATFSSGG